MKGQSSENLKGKIAAAEAQMKAKLNEIRATFVQSGDKGVSAEDIFREFLRKYLATRFRVGHGEVIDHKGRRSGETDVVIVNEDHPYTFAEDQPGLFFIEGVGAAAEIKTNLTSAELDESLKKSHVFKLLESDPGIGTITQGNPSDVIRFSKCPPWFLFAFESQLNLSTIKASIERFIEKEKIEKNRLADAIFVLDRGWVINFGDGKGALIFKTPEGISVEGWVWKDSDSVLFILLGWLHAVMLRMIRFEPVLAKYIILESET